MNRMGVVPHVHAVAFILLQQASVLPTARSVGPLTDLGAMGRSRLANKSRGGSAYGDG